MGLVYVSQDYGNHGLRLIAYSEIDATEKYEREQAGQGVLVLISGGTVGAAKGRGKAAEVPLNNLESI